MYDICTHTHTHTHTHAFDIKSNTTLSVTTDISNVIKVVAKTMLKSLNFKKNKEGTVKSLMSYRY